MEVAIVGGGGGFGGDGEGTLLTMMVPVIMAMVTALTLSVKVSVVVAMAWALVLARCEVKVERPAVGSSLIRHQAAIATGALECVKFSAPSRRRAHLTPFSS